MTLDAAVGGERPHVRVRVRDLFVDYAAAGLIVGVCEGVQFMLERPVRDRRDRIQTALVLVGFAPFAWCVAALAFHLLRSLVARLLAGKSPNLAFGIAAAAVFFPLARELAAGERVSEGPAAFLYAPLATAIVGAAILFVRRSVLAYWETLRRPWLALAGFGACAAFYILDRRLYVGLYPAAHAVLAVLALAAMTVFSRAIARRGPDGARFTAPVLLLVLLGGAAGFFGYVYRRPELAQPVGDRTVVAAKAIEFLSRAGVAPAGRVDLTPEGFAAMARVFPVSATPRLLAAKEPFDAVVLITLEALRPDHLGVGGYHRPLSPALDAFAAKAMATVDAWTSTNASHDALVALLAGIYRGVTEPEGGEVEKVFRSFREIDAETVAVFPEGGMLEHKDLFGSFDRVIVYDGRSKDALPKLAPVLDASRTRPLFLWVHLFDPHYPYEPEAEDRIFGSSPIDLYDGEIRALDRAFGVLVARLDAAFPAGRLAIGVTADHGEAFGEHGVYYHKTGLHEEQVRVPIFLRAPGLKPGVVASPASHVDILPTLARLAGWPLPAGRHGRYLDVLPVDPNVIMPPVFCRHEKRGVAIRQGTKKVISTTRLGAFQVYDLAADPRERKDLGAERPPFADSLKRSLTAFDLGRDGLLTQAFRESELIEEAARARNHSDHFVKRFAGAILDVRKL